jgi:iron complex outermembrane receptor protein
LATHFRVSLRGLLVLTAGFSSLTWGAADDAAPEQQRRVIEEVIVTAQKREQSLQDVPVSVSSFDSRFIEELGNVDVGELVQYTPNVKFNNSLGYAPVLTIRGFGTPPLGRGLEPSVGLVIDGVFYGRSSYMNDAFFDMDRLEILRGPQGTLFGKNTIAGLINFTTRNPDFDNSGFVTLGRGKYDTKSIEAGASIALIDEVLAARVSARIQEKDWHVYNTARDEQNSLDDRSGRVKLQWLINNRSDLILNAWKSRQREVGLILQLRKATEKSLSVFREYDPQTEADDFNGTLSMNRDTYSDRDTESANFQYKLDIGDVGIVQGLNMQVIGGWSEMISPYAIDGDFSPIDFIEFGTDEPDAYEQKLLEIQFSGAVPAPFGLGNGIDFLAGIFASKAHHSVSVHQKNGTGIVDYTRAGAFFDPAPSLYIPLPLNVNPSDDGRGETIFAANDVDTDNIAYFAQFDWYLSETISAIIGLRYGEEERDGRISAGRTATTVAAPVVTGQENFDEHIQKTDYDFTPKLTLIWQPAEELTLFATATEGFKSGGIAAGVFNDDNLTFEPETAQAYEIGVKSKLFDGSLMLNATVFKTEYQNLQVRNFDGRSIFVKNAADAETQGLELDFFWLPPVPYLSIGGSAGFVDAKYLNYLCAPAVAGTPTGTGDASCFDESNDPTTTILAPSFQDLSGEPLAFAPEVSGSLYASMNIPLFSTGVNVLLGLDAVHQGEHFIDTDNDPVATQQATTKLNARVGLKSDSDTWSVILNAKNMTGEEEAVLVLDQASLPGNYVSAALSPDPIYNLTVRIAWH